MENNTTIQRNDFDLYYNGYIIQFENGEKLLKREPIAYTPSQPDEYHTVKKGETLTRIAWRRYNKLTPNASRYWKFIADVNGIQNPLDISSYVGKELLIPNYNLIRLSE